MNPIIKWPGGKSREIGKLKGLMPADYRRYVEPFFGGGALFFHLTPKAAVINDNSRALMQFYKLIKAQDKELHELLLCYRDSFRDLVSFCGDEMPELMHIFFRLKEGFIGEGELSEALGRVVERLSARLDGGFQDKLLLDREEFHGLLRQMAEDKWIRTVNNYNKKPFSTHDLCENLITGFASGYYMYFRKILNDLSLGRLTDRSEQYQAANFYFIREYCYGSMFRYNKAGEFNIPYGGMSYNRKDMGAKIDSMFNQEIAALFSDTEIHCADFEAFLRESRLTEDDFVFLDPPYDTDFSDYEGNEFTKSDQERLARTLKGMPARFILIIKNTEFIHELYARDFHIVSFDKQYTYNVRSRNDRKAEHLIITNMQV